MDNESTTDPLVVQCTQHLMKKSERELKRPGLADERWDERWVLGNGSVTSLTETT